MQSAILSNTCQGCLLVTKRHAHSCLCLRLTITFVGGVPSSWKRFNSWWKVQSILAGIVCKTVVMVYLWDESANIIVLVTSLVEILIDVWKVSRAMRLTTTRFAGIPVICLTSRVTKEKADDFDSIAMKYLAVCFLPVVAGLGGLG